MADVIQLMTTEPGVEGQTFIPESLEKIRRLREKLNQMGLDTDIEVDGNITKENIQKILETGVDFVSSGALTHSAPILDISMKNLHAVE